MAGAGKLSSGKYLPNSIRFIFLPGVTEGNLMTFMSLLGGLGNKRHVARNRDLTLLLIVEVVQTGGLEEHLTPRHHSTTHAHMD